jgi:hypothetical protein
MAELGWHRVDRRPWTKLHARWAHRDGWKLVHCGHPTAIWPWGLYDPSGRMHCTALTTGGSDPTCGVAWRDLRSAVDYVAEMGLRALKAMDGAETRRPAVVRWLESHGRDNV